MQNDVKLSTATMTDPLYDGLSPHGRMVTCGNAKREEGGPKAGRRTRLSRHGNSATHHAAAKLQLRRKTVGENVVVRTCVIPKIGAGITTAIGLQGHVESLELPQ